MNRKIFAFPKHTTHSVIGWRRWWRMVRQDNSTISRHFLRETWWRMVRQDNTTISKHFAWDSSLQLLEHVRTTKQMWRCDMHWNAGVQLSYFVNGLVGEAEILYALKCRRAIVLLRDWPSWWSWDSITQLTLLQAATALSFFPSGVFFFQGGLAYEICSLVVKSEIRQVRVLP